MARARRMALALRAPDRWWPVLVLGLYLLVVVLGVTNSSLALLDDPVDGTQGLLAGHPRPIRSDEWIKATPILIGQLSSGDSSFMPTLATPVVNGGTSAAGPVSLLLAAEYHAATYLARVDLDSGLAAAWWFPAVLFALGLPSLVRRLGAPYTLGMAGVVAIALSPANEWWSWTPVRVTAYAVVAAAAAAAAATRLADRSRRNSLVGGGWVLLSGLMLAKLALSYAPWVVTIGVPILSVTAAWLVWRRRSWRLGIAVVAACAVLGIALMAGYLVENREYYQALAGTVYPGARQVTGAFVGLSLLLGAPQLWYLRRPDVTITAQAGNASELASAYTILLIVVVAAGLAYTLIPRAGQARLPRHSLALGLPVAGLLLWCAVMFPPEALHVPVLNVVPPDRIAQVIGIPLTLMAVLAVAGLRRRSAHGSTTGLGLVIGAATFALLAPAASDMRLSSLPYLPIWSIWGVSMAWAVGVGLLVARPARAWTLAPLGVLIVGTTILVNPAQQGTADLRTSAGALAVQALHRELPDHQRVAVSDPWAGALLMANAVPLVNGYQGAPDESAWHLLDPTGAAEPVWNRGASLVQFQWRPPGSSLEIVSPQLDQVVVQADPCDPALDALDVGAVVSHADLGDRSCLRPLGSVTMAGQPKWVYLREGA